MFGGGSYSNAYEERARLKKKKKKAKAAAAASAAKSKPSVKKYPFAVRLNEEQLDNHLGRVLKLFANKATTEKLKAMYLKAKESNDKTFDIDDAAMEEDYKVFDKEWESNSMGLSRLEYRKVGMECIRRINVDYPKNHALKAKLEMFMQSIGLVVNSIVMPKEQFDQSYKSYMLAQQNQRRMVKKALVLWGPKHDPSPQAAEWMKRSKDKIEPILARWDTLTPDQLMQETCKIPPQDQETIAFYKVLKMVAIKKDGDKKKAAAASGKLKS